MKWAILFLFFGLCPALADEVRPPAVAGSWYPGDAETLADYVDGLLDAAPAAARGARPPRALILPHAGYPFSGATAAAGVARVRGAAFERVILLGPAHRVGFHGLSIARVKAYATPLGQIPLDLQAVARLRRDPLVTRVPEAHAREHSLEMELPLLQRALKPGWRLVPILVGRLEGGEYAQAADLLRPLWDAHTLVVVSSDFTHFGWRYRYQPFPYDATRLKALDTGAFAAIEAGDAQAFLDYQARTGDTICGYRPIAILLHLLPPGSRIERLAYTTSAEVTGETGNSVSYAAFALWPAAKADPHGTPPRLGEADLRRLHRLAELAVTLAVHPGDEGLKRRLEAERAALPERLKQSAGAFVTLKRQGRLRGCIGTIRPILPLDEAVVENARHAALHDPRFLPLDGRELQGLDLEVSVLTPPRPIPSWQAFRPGKDGIVLELDGRRAVFLPEVASEQGWNRRQTLTHLARKAGLPGDAWRSPRARFWVFQTQIYAAPYQRPAP